MFVYVVMNQIDIRVYKKEISKQDDTDPDQLSYGAYKSQRT